MTDCPELVKSEQYITSYDQLLGNTSEQTLGTYVKVYCIDGYSLKGSEVVLCTAGGWIPQPDPYCTVEGDASRSVEERLKETLGETGYALFITGLVLSFVVLATLLCLCYFYFRRQPKKRKLHDHSYHQRAPPPAYITEREMYPRDLHSSYSPTRGHPREVYQYDDSLPDDFLDDDYDDDERRIIASDPYSLHSRDLFWSYAPDVYSSRDTLPVLPRVHRNGNVRLTRSSQSLISGSRERDRYRHHRSTLGYGWSPV